jgi:hypothetical protein
MDADERRQTEAAIANISRMKKAVEADPAAAGIAIYLRGRG